jgi:hypothetical protein
MPLHTQNKAEKKKFDPQEEQLMSLIDIYKERTGSNKKHDFIKEFSGFFSYGLVMKAIQAVEDENI